MNGAQDALFDGAAGAAPPDPTKNNLTLRIQYSFGTRLGRCGSGGADNRGQRKGFLTRTQPVNRLGHIIIEQFFGHHRRASSGSKVASSASDPADLNPSR